MDDLALACVDHGLGGVGRMGVSVSAMPGVQGFISSLFITH
jgi:hypothetical protein